jgi:hypothetical protein
VDVIFSILINVISVLACRWVPFFQYRHNIGTVAVPAERLAAKPSTTASGSAAAGRECFSSMYFTFLPVLFIRLSLCMYHKMSVVVFCRDNENYDTYTGFLFGSALRHFAEKKN